MTCMKIKKILLIVLISFIKHAFATNYEGVVSIQKRFFLRGNIYERTSIARVDIPRVEGFYPLHAVAEEPFRIVHILPAYEIEKINKANHRLVSQYHVMPHYMINKFNNNVFLFVKITLRMDSSIYSKETLCWLPLEFFINQDQTFKQVNDVITFTTRFSDYNNRVVNSTFNLMLDDSFNNHNIQRNFDEFNEDDYKSCPRLTKNCLTRFYNKIKASFGD